MLRNEAKLSVEPALDPMNGRLPPRAGDRARERNILRADRNAVLCIAAILYASGSHQRLEPFTRFHLPRAVSIKEHRLTYRGCANELILVGSMLSRGKLRVRFVIPAKDFHFAVFWTGIETTPAGHALRQGITKLLHLLRLARARATVEVVIYLNPCLHAL